MTENAVRPAPSAQNFEGASYAAFDRERRRLTHRLTEACKNSDWSLDNAPAARHLQAAIAARAAGRHVRSIRALVDAHNALRAYGSPYMDAVLTNADAAAERDRWGLERTFLAGQVLIVHTHDDGIVVGFDGEGYQVELTADQYYALPAE
ncbi:hypothetical protein [Microbispora sp. NPDC049125]|uniref:hypothetical protein n=1 Tax=Microbispora sp. NPDC049125 TaxID=3154929 RepID=UPI003466E1B7